MGSRLQLDLNTIEHLQNQIDALKVQVQLSSIVHAPTVPRHAVGSEPANLINGQTWIDDSDALRIRASGTTYVQDNKWLPWTPTWGATSGSTPTIGNGTYGCYYMQVGHIGFINFHVMIGSTSSIAGSGGWSFTFPTAFNGRIASGPNSQMCGLVDAGVSTHYGTVQHFGLSPDKMGFYNVRTDSASAYASSEVNPTTPFSWGVGDYIVANFWVRLTT